MQVFRRSDRSPLAEWWRTVDKGLIAAALILLGAGLVLSLAAGPAAASRIGYDDSFHFVYRQVVFAVASAGVLVASSTLNEMWVRRVCAGLFIICFFMMAALLMFGHEAKGATRWIRVWGTTFQPSEIIKPALIVLAGSVMETLARERNTLRVVSEVFADRTYQPDGSLTPRTRAGAMIENEADAAAQVVRMVREGKVRAVGGVDVNIRAETICLHGDGPHAVDFARRLRSELASGGVGLLAFDARGGGRIQI